MKARIFIGSSKEGEGIAYAIQENLEPDLDCTVWTQGVFGASSYPLEALIKAVSENDFGVFVFSPDDVTAIRGQPYAAVRDNVILESGMFIGRYGRDRNFIVVPLGVSDFRIPSDLLGLTLLEYDPTRLASNAAAALGAACNRIRNAIRGDSTFNRRLAFSPSAPRGGTTYPLKLWIEIRNSTGTLVVITSRFFKIGGALRPDPKTKGNPAKGEYEIKFPDPGDKNKTQFDYFLRDGETVPAWIGIDPSHTDAELRTAIASATCGEWHLTYNWLGPNPTRVEHVERL